MARLAGRVPGFPRVPGGFLGLQGQDSAVQVGSGRAVAATLGELSGEGPGA